jgi:signal transduction histidine kinase
LHVQDPTGSSGAAREPEGVLEGLSLARAVLGASAPGDALRVLGRFLAVRFRCPVAGWIATPGQRGLSLIVAQGLPEGHRRKLRRHMKSLPRWEQAPVETRQFVKRRFQALTGLKAVQVLDAGSALVLVGGSSPSLKQALHQLGPILRQALERLASADEERQSDDRIELGLAWTAHELRDPLLVARMVLDRLAQGSDDPETAKRLLSQAREELDDLASLVDTMLAWAVGVGSLSRRELDLRRTIEEAVRGCSIEAAQDRVTIAAPPGVKLNANREHLVSAISNLVRNALAYSPKESNVLVEGDRRNGVARISVRDHGPGIPPDERKAIFEPFRRGAAGQSRRGGGLGLFIARRAVEAHGGVIWADSGTEGATFHFEIPHADVKQP